MKRSSCCLGLSDHQVSLLASLLPLDPPKITGLVCPPVQKVPGHSQSPHISPTPSPPLRDPWPSTAQLLPLEPLSTLRWPLQSQAHSAAPGPLLYLEAAAHPISSSSTTSSRKASPIILPWRPCSQTCRVQSQPAIEAGSHLSLGLTVPYF